MLYAIIGMLVIIADQYIKFWVQGHLALGASEEFIPGILSLANVHNDGAAFGFLAGDGARIPFIILAGVFTVAVIIALATRLISGRRCRWSIVLVPAGALSNCLDRVMYGYVQDMFKTEFMNFPVFNLADVFITIFAIVFALAVIFGKTRKNDDDDYEFEDEEEEEEPRRVSRKKQARAARGSKRRAARYEDDEDEEDDEEEEEEPPVRSRKPVKAAKPAKRARRAVVVEEDEEEEEEYEEPAPAPVRKPVKQQRAAVPAARTKQRATVEDEDPFAGWERTERTPAKTPAKQKAVEPAARAAAPAQGARAAQARTAQRSAASAAPVRQPAASAAKPAARPAPKPAPKAAVEEEFSLDDILNEFK